jgi:TetR/AcrR family transcriptional repressor of mexJK operon
MEALLTAASHVFVAHGFGHASYEMIARHANVSTKTIYSWFGGKSGLFAAVVERYASRIAPRLSAALERHRDDPKNGLFEAGRIILAFTLEPELLAVHRAVIAASGELPEIGATFYERGPGRGAKMLAEYLSHCDAAGHLTVPDPVRSAEAFMALISGGVHARRLVQAEQGKLSGRELEAHLRPVLTMFLVAHKHAAAPNAEAATGAGGASE